MALGEYLNRNPVCGRTLIDRSPTQMESFHEPQLGQWETGLTTD